jgi:hypothetical protein
MTDIVFFTLTTSFPAPFIINDSKFKTLEQQKQQRGDLKDMKELSVVAHRMEAKKYGRSICM